MAQADAIERMEAQHHRLEELVTQVTGALDGLATDPQRTLCEQAARSVGRMTGLSQPALGAMLACCAMALSTAGASRGPAKAVLRGGG
ncbi:hypothetical protein ACIPSA_28290 [Streptomyces sp. NPDC086549]|uniref:hypothetical protein n=1 Tax=Streptomyces sp. NPDC086549 TaxID=3365752 RepID=UPI0037F3C83C